MAGERLPSARLSGTGVEGDRLVQAIGADGRVLTSRSKPGLLGRRASLGPDGEPRVDGLPWDSAETALAVTAAAGAGARLVKTGAGEGFDILPLLVLTDGALREFGRDPRRLRPNLVIGGVEGLSERGWEGRSLRVGGAIVAPGDPSRSILLQRITRRGPGQMPPLASAVVDERSAELLRAWIAGLK